MPFVYGSKCSVWLDVLDVSQYFNDSSLSIDVDTADTSTFGGSWKTFIEGLPTSKIALKGYYDLNANAEFQGDVMNGGSIVTVGPGGLLAIGDYARLMDAHETSLAESSPVGGVVLTDVAFQGDTALGFGWTLHPMGADSGTTTGADRDDGAATSTGWMAHLHVTAVTGSPTSWTVKLQDAATTDWTDVTGGAFTATNVPAAQRLVSAAATTTLRRHVRYVATVVGGTAPTITFGLAYSRNR